MLTVASSQDDRHKKPGEVIPNEPETASQINGIWRWAGLGAALLYLSFTLLLGVNRIGFHYDEAISLHGAVHMLNSAGEPTFAHPPGSWISFAGRYWPLVIIQYAGALKNYLMFLPFAVFGPSAEVARVVNALLGAFGIFGIATLLKHEINPRVAAAAGCMIAIHPAYLDQTLFDYGVVVVWMAILGLLSIAILYYRKRPTTLAASLIGLGMGIGVWNRVNFAWFLASALIAVVIFFRKRLLIPVRHLAALSGGALFGVLPMVLFQILSDWLILDFMKAGQAQGSFGQLVMYRLQMLTEVLVSDAEMRAIWSGPPVPLWQVYFFSLVIIFALIVCFALKHAGSERVILWRRVSALTFILYALTMVTSRLNVTQHHLVTLVPIAAVVVALACQGVIHQWKNARIPVLAIALLYAGSALYWNVTAAQGLRETGGVNTWSDGIYAVNDYLTANHPGGEIQVLDWGFQNNLYVVSNAKIRSHEIFWGATPERTGANTPWSEVIARGGVFLTTGGIYQHFPSATQGLFAALTASGQTYNRIEFNQRSGAPYAQLIEIQPSAGERVSPRPQNKTERGTLTAEPNPITVCDGSRTGVTTLTWTSTGTTAVEIHVGKPDGDLFMRTGPSGTGTTHKWVGNGMVFYLQDVSGGRPLTRENTLATITVNVTDTGCP
jgi:hypothetical protein